MEAQLGESTRRPQAVHLTMADRMSCGFHPHLKKKKRKNVSYIFSFDKTASMKWAECEPWMWKLQWLKVLFRVSRGLGRKRKVRPSFPPSPGPRPCVAMLGSPLGRVSGQLSSRVRRVGILLEAWTRGTGYTTQPPQPGLWGAKGGECEKRGG